jgi:hypothetical protein
MKAQHRLAHKMRDQSRDVFPAVAQGRHFHREHSQPVKQIQTETPFVDFPAQVAIRRGNNADIHSARSFIANALKLTFLQNTQELGLERERNLAHLIQEQRPTVGELKAADAIAHGARERASHMAEKFAFKQLMGNRSAIYLY